MDRLRAHPEHAGAEAPLTVALAGLLHGLAAQTRFPTLERVEDVRDGRDGEVSHGTDRQAFAFFERVQLLKHHPGNEDNREALS